MHACLLMGFEESIGCTMCLPTPLVICFILVICTWLSVFIVTYRVGRSWHWVLCTVHGQCKGLSDKSHKKVCQTQTSTCRDEILKNQPNKTGTTPQYFYTIPTSCAILPKLCVCICFLVVCRRGLSCRWKGVAWVCCA